MKYVLMMVRQQVQEQANVLLTKYFTIIYRFLLIMKDIYKLVPPQQYVLTNKKYIHIFFSIVQNYYLSHGEVKSIMIYAYMIKQVHILLDKLHQLRGK